MESKSRLNNWRGRIFTAGILLAVLILIGILHKMGYVNFDATNEATEYIYAMETEMQIEAYGKEADEAVAAAVAEINRLDALLSVGVETSEVAQLNEAGTYEVSEDVLTILEEAQYINTSTNGAFDPTVYPLMEAWGFTTKDYTVPSAETIAELLQYVGMENVTVSGSTVTLAEGTKIDFGGIAKGFTSDRIMEIFAEYDLTGGMVSLGGNVQVYEKTSKGSDSWRIAIVNPTDTTSYLGSVSVEDKAVITSGAYQRYFEEDGVTYHHILDPSTGYSANNGLISVTIVSEDGMLADGLSTAIYVMGLEEATAYYRQHNKEFDMVLMTDDGMVYITEGLADGFSSDLDYEVISDTE